jgi:hypothetical protein
MFASLPPSTIPEDLINDFTMGGRTPVLYHYYNNTTSALTRVHNTEKIYKNTFKQLNKKTFVYYGKEASAFYDVLADYPVSGKTVLVWGLVGCNCEAIALWNNAEKVYVVDYNKPICDHKRVEVLTHNDLKTRNIKTDFAFSYSSFEHDGLGRYGDPIDPNGDIRAMQDAYDSLQDNAILFLGIPLGQDVINWNGGRIYGKIRLPLLLKSWHCVDIFDSYKKQNIMPFELPLGQNKQMVLVLRKITTDYPDDEALLEAIKNKDKNIANTSNPKILAAISQYILDYKRI